MLQFYSTVMLFCHLVVKQKTFAYNVHFLPCVFLVIKWWRNPTVICVLGCVFCVFAALFCIGCVFSLHVFFLKYCTLLEIVFIDYVLSIYMFSKLH